MKLKRLIEQLQKFNGDLDVKFSASIESGRSISECKLEGTHFISVIKKGKTFYFESDGVEEKYKTPTDIIEFIIGGDENSYE